MLGWRCIAVALDSTYYVDSRSGHPCISIKREHACMWPSQLLDLALWRNYTMETIFKVRGLRKTACKPMKQAASKIRTKSGAKIDHIDWASYWLRLSQKTTPPDREATTLCLAQLGFAPQPCDCTPSKSRTTPQIQRRSQRVPGPSPDRFSFE